MRALVLPLVCGFLLVACGKPANLTPPIYAALPAPDADAEGAPTARLPVDTRPLHYRLSLTLIPEQPVYKGKVAIDVALDRPRETLWLHQKDLRASSVQVVLPNGQVLPGTLETQSPSGLTALKLAQPVGPGPVRIEIAFEANVGKRLSGLYRAEAAGVPYLFTQFEAISAREAFPCFDEPRFKTPFEITLRVKPEHTAIANTLQVSSEPIFARAPEGALRPDAGLKEVRFATTEKLPTYLVAFAVGPFDVVDAAPLPANAVRPVPRPLRGVAVKGRGHDLSYVLTHTAPLLERLESYFGIAYPYDKLDLIAVPDFGAGAMENAGAITFRDTILLVRPDATENQRRQLAYVNAHELAHQWFGNLVTMPWWDDIWLNEAFATWMGNRVVDEVHPEYRARLGAMAWMQHAMEVDSQAAARQIRQPVASDDQIAGAFDAITYAKGGAVLNMFERYLGAEVFRAGLRLYMQRHRFGNATAADLVQALVEVSGQPQVKSAFASFLNQPGVPLVTASVSCAQGAPRLRLSQSRYLPLGSQVSQGARWEIPVCVRYGNSSTAEPLEQCVLLKEPELETALGPAAGNTACPSWLMPNAGANGYYRWALSPTEVSALLTAVPKLSAFEQVSLASNLLAAMQAGALSADQALTALAKLAGLPERQVLEMVLGAFAVVDQQLLDEKTRPAYRARVAALVEPLYRELGFSAPEGLLAAQYASRGLAAPAAGSAKAPSEDTERSLKRAVVVRALGLTARDPAVSSLLAKFGRAELGLGPAPAGVLAVELRMAALSAALREDPQHLLEPAIARLLASEDAQERSRLLSAISTLDDPAVSDRVLALGLEPRLRTNERMSPLFGQAGQPATQKRAVSWLEQNFDAYVAQVSTHVQARVFGVVGMLCEREEIDAAKAFFGPRAQALPGGAHEYALALEAAELCQAFRAGQGEAARRWFAVP